MPPSVVKVDGLEVAAVGSEPTHINIHIHQESGVAQLLRTGSSLLPSCPLLKSTEAVRMKRAELAIGTAQIVLGSVSAALGVLFCLGTWNDVFSTGCAFWTAAVAIVTGVITIVHEKRQGGCWNVLAPVLTLASFSTAVAAIVIGVGDFRVREYYNPYICESSSQSTWPTLPPSTPDPQELWRQKICLQYLSMLSNLFLGIEALTLGVFIVLLALSLTSIGMGLRRLCCRVPEPQEEDEAEKKLLTQDSPPASPYKKPVEILHL
ncbi:transmembrane protein 176A-like [Ornithorhynchus anatinus]|uniref:Transmembrane protein 176B n=1 Tax=Ornithorhynchus anatinus TaxID=9258 RepID=A0A6I8NPN2_ORNAN|nr:transmembrane protein 176A-like [Ornithorhynchus anatinus]